MTIYPFLNEYDRGRHEWWLRRKPIRLEASVLSGQSEAHSLQDLRDRYGAQADDIETGAAALVARITGGRFSHDLISCTKGPFGTESLGPYKPTTDTP